MGVLAAYGFKWAAYGVGLPPEATHARGSPRLQRAP